MQQVKKNYSKNGFNINFFDMMLGLLDKMLAKPEIVSDFLTFSHVYSKIT